MMAEEPQIVAGRAVTGDEIAAGHGSPITGVHQYPANIPHGIQKQGANYANKIFYNPNRRAIVNISQQTQKDQLAAAGIVMFGVPMGGYSGMLESMLDGAGGACSR